MSGAAEVLPIDSDDITDMPIADEIFGRRGVPTPWKSSRAVLTLVVEALPTVEADCTADFIQQLALAFVDLCDELGAVRSTLSAALEESHREHTEIVRLEGTLARLRDEYRALRLQTLRQTETA